MALEIVPIYAALLGVLYLVLSGRAIRARRAARKAIGPLGDTALDRHVRVHANFAEYAPFVLLLLAFAEIRGAPEGLLHIACAGLVFGRVVHAWGVSHEPENFKFRRYGMMATFFALVVAVTLLIASYLFG
ncbi:MAG: MAPEG family protein [Telmatospirillum sp.]|nr:MAPEG family protein [Telmatospirillum sp.]